MHTAKILVLIVLALQAGTAHARDWVADAEQTLTNPRSSEQERLDALQLLEVRTSSEAGAIVLGQVLSSDDSVRVRKAAASALWGHEHALLAEAALRHALQDDPEVSVRAAGALHAAGVASGEVADGFRRGLDSRNRGTAFSAARGLAGVDPPESLLPAMLAYLDWQLEQGDVQGAFTAQEALEKLVDHGLDDAAYRALAVYVESGGPGAPYALASLAELSDRPVGHVQWLEQLAERSPSSEVRAVAIRQLGFSEPTAPTLGAIADGLVDASPDVQQNAISACGQQAGSAGTDCILRLAALLGGAPDDDIRADAGEALGDILGQTEGVDVPDGVWEAVRDAALNDPDDDVREHAIEALADMPGDTPRTLAALAEIAGVDSLAYNQARALGRLARMVGYPGTDVPESVREHVAPLVNDEDAEVARLARLVIDAL